MPKKRAKKGREKQPRRQSGRLVRIIGDPAFWIAVVLVALAVAVGLDRAKVVEWMELTWNRAVVLFGWGMVIAALVLLVVAGVFWRRNAGVFIRRWNRWLGAAAILAAIWGGLSFYRPLTGPLGFVGLGGSIGYSILSVGAGIMGLELLWLAGLVLIGAIFISPDAVYRGFKWLGVRVWRGIRALWRRARRVRPRPAVAVPAVVGPQPPEGEVAAAPTAAVSAGRPEERPPAAERTVREKPEEKGKAPERYRPTLTVGGWQLPPMDILDKATETELSQADIEKRAKVIEEALASYGVEVKVVEKNIGPTVTQFGVEPGWDYKYKEIKEKDRDGRVTVKMVEAGRTRVKVDRITGLANDLALALAAPSIRIEAPIPGKSLVGIEVPNTTFGTVALRGAIESAPFQKLKAKSKLAVALGRGSGGEVVVGDLARMPHLLIAGATGSGKTACLNSIIACLLMHNTPDDVRFVMLDPKRVELVAYNALPHLVAPVVVEPDRAVAALRWLVLEMDRRYRQFAEVGARNIEGYNRDRPTAELMPYLVLVIDELADLMMHAMDEVEHSLVRLAQLARATGIHLIVATQRPSVDVITGLIKANFPTRISFAVTSQVDSRTILDTVGAEKLLGRGDMLYMPTDAAKPKRLQGSYVGEAEIDRLVYFWGNQKRPGTVPVIFDDVKPQAAEAGIPDDPLLDQARELCDKHGQVSASYLQRKLAIGYPRAARIAEILREEKRREEGEGGGDEQSPS